VLSELEVPNEDNLDACESDSAVLSVVASEDIEGVLELEG
jgi:hypothetical protein